MRILFVENDANDIELTVYNLRQNLPRARIDVRNTLEQARAALLDGASGYALILTDLALPDGSGLELLSFTIDNELSLPVVVLTGSGGQQKAITALSAGAADYIVKSGDYADRLAHTLLNAVERHRTAGQHLLHRINVLYVEDNANDAELARVHLQERARNIRLSITPDAKSAMAMLSQDDARDKYHVLMLDNDLPDMNGLDLLKRVRYELAPHAGVLMVSGHRNEMLAVEALKLGATAYVPKEGDYLFHLATEIESAYLQSLMLKERHFLRLLQNAVESAGDGIIIAADKRGDFRVSYVNDALLRICGREREQVLDLDIRSLFVGDPAQIGARILNEALPRNEEARVELCAARPDGSPYWIELFVRPIEYAYGSSGHYVAIVKDISERKHDENMLRLAAKVFESFDEAVVIVDENFRIANANASFISSTGYLLKEVINQPPAMIEHLRSPDDAAPIWQQIAEDASWRGESLVHCKNGGSFPVWVTASVDRDAEGNISNYILGLTDISDFKESQRRLQFLANYDSLTGLLNRNLFSARLTQALAAARGKDARVAVLFIDLDQFKMVNDSLGHAVGDTLLVSTAERLRHAVREHDLVCRLGGDEYIVAITELSGHEQAIQAAARILEGLSVPFELGGHNIVSTASLGLALFPEDGQDADTLIRKADTAMFKAKERGRGMFVFFAEEMNTEVHERLTLEQGLRAALQREELFLHFQPQVALTDMRISGVEALLRWQHAELGLVSPVRFIPIAETSGLILPIGEWVIAETARKLNGWNGAFPEDLKVSFNLSPVQFQQGDIDVTIGNILQESGVAPELIEVEITESAIMDNRESTRAMMNKLKNIGVSIAIDDFGIGYSSLSYLKRFPVDRLKIDRSFVSGVSDNRQDAAIVAAIISVAHSLGIEVVAEGVETEEQLQFLAAHGCEFAQGFLFSRPVDEEQIAGLMLRQSARLN